MSCVVSRSCGVIVKPSEPTPSGTLNLSVFESSPNLKINVPSLHIFRYGDEPAKVIKEALSKLLVPYYPLAGRLIESSRGELHVECSGEGGWFVEASANYSLDSVEFFDNLFFSLYDDLLPTPPPPSSGMDPLIEIQVTTFTCKGFAVGFRLSHSLCDGLGAGNFAVALGEFARGFSNPSVQPIWRREAIPSPSWMLTAHGDPKQPQNQYIPTHKLEKAVIDISLQEINKLKTEYKSLTGDYCSTFDVVVASLWRYRTQAIGLDKKTKVSLVFVANIRHLINPPLPEAYYGNCVFPVTVTVSSGWLVKASNAEVVKLIKHSKTKVPSDFGEWVKKGKLDDDTDPFTTPLQYTTLCISDWGQVGFRRADYGWGCPAYVLGVEPGLGFMPSVFMVSPPAPKKGIRLLTSCVTSAHLPYLLHNYKTPTLSRL